MSTIGSLNTDTSMTSLLQNLAQRQQGVSRTGGPSEAQKAAFDAKFEEAAEAAGVDSDKISGLRDQIQSAITSTLEEAQSSGDTSSLKDNIKTAVENVLKENGIDPEDLESRLQTAMKNTMSAMGGSSGMGEMGGPPPMDGGMGGPPPADGQSTTATSTSSSTDSTISSNTEDQGLLFLLQQMNNSDQNDFLKTFTDILFGLDVQA